MKSQITTFENTGPVIGSITSAPIYEWVETTEHGRFRYFGVASDATYNALRKKHGDGTRVIAIGSGLYLNMEDERNNTIQDSELRTDRETPDDKSNKSALPWPLSAFIPISDLGPPIAFTDNFFRDPWRYITRNGALVLALELFIQIAKATGMTALYFTLLALSGLVGVVIGVLYAASHE